MNIEEKPKFATPFEWIDGKLHVRELVDHFVT